MVEELVNWVSNHGFPIAVTIYLLVRFEKKIETLESAIAKLTNTLSSKEKNQK